MEMIATPRPGPTKLVVGLFFTLLGIALTLDNLDLFDAGAVLHYWPVLLVILGLLYLGDATRRGMAIVLVAGGLLLLTPPLLRHGHLFYIDFWPLILIGIGAVIVLRALGIQPAASHRSMVNVLTSRKLRLTPEELDGRHILSFMGGVDIELAEPGSETSTVAVEVVSMWGGTTLRIPAGWEVQSEVFPIMGGVENKAQSTGRGRKLLIRGLVLMSGIEIKNAV